MKNLILALILFFIVLLSNFYYFLKLLKRLATAHKKKYEEDFDLPLPVWTIFVAVSPINLINFFKFIFSKDFLDDLKVRYFSNMYKTSLLLTFVFFIVTCITWVCTTTKF